VAQLRALFVTTTSIPIAKRESHAAQRLALRRLDFRRHLTPSSESALGENSRPLALAIRDNGEEG